MNRVLCISVPFFLISLPLQTAYSTPNRKGYIVITDSEKMSTNNGLHIKRWHTIYLEEYFGYPQGEGSTYQQYHVEYRYNEDEALSEIEQWTTQDQSLSYPLDTSRIAYQI